MLRKMKINWKNKIDKFQKNGLNSVNSFAMESIQEVVYSTTSCISF